MSTKKIQIIGSLGDKIYKQNEEPIDAPDGTLWIDMDAESSDESGIAPVIVDATLRQEGWAADAKATGDAIRDLNNTKVPTTRTINGKPLTSNIVLTADDIGVTTETDKNLTVEGMAADAKAVGDKFTAMVGVEPVSTQINKAFAQKSQVQIITWEADD